MKKQLSMLAILVGASLNAQAAQSSFFTIVDDEVKGYASGISTDGSGLIGINTKNNMAEYFSTVRSADFLVDRFRFEQGCFLSSSVCDSFWDENPGFAYQWRRDFLDGVDQRSGIGYVPQGREIFSRLSVEDNLRMGLSYCSAGTQIPGELYELFPEEAPAPPGSIEQALEQLRALWHGYRIAVHVTPDHPGAGVDTPEDLIRVRQIFASIS